MDREFCVCVELLSALVERNTRLFSGMAECGQNM